MTGTRTLLLIVVFVLTGIWVSQAAAQFQFGPILYTPPLWGNHFVCAVANVSGDTKLVTAKIIVHSKELSTQPISSGCKTVNLKAGQACGEIATLQGVELAYCRITVAPGTKEDVRGSLIGTNSASGRSAAVEAR